MGHYKSNLRDIEFNLFEVFGAARSSAPGPFADIDDETARNILDEVERLATGPLAESFVDGDRNPPVFDPETHSVTHAGELQELLPGAAWTPSGGGSSLPRRARRHAAPAQPASGRRPSWCSAPTRRSGCTPPAPAFARILYEIGTAEQKRFAQLDGRAAVGRHHGAHRARRRLRRRRRPYQGRPAAGRHLAHRGRQALHHQRRARHGREHLPPRARPPRGRTARAPRACRCSSCRSSTSTWRPASSASATASTSPTSRRRWA